MATISRTRPLFPRIFNSTRLLSRSGSVCATKLVYSEYGDPVTVVKKVQEDLQDDRLADHDVLIRMLAAPVNPADINTIQGKYPSKPALPAVPGNEGVGEVLKVGKDVKELKEGDRVVPMQSHIGTWRTHAVVPDNGLLRVPRGLGLVEAATLTVNPCTALRMLRDFVDLKPGDTVIQNGANSSCGQYVIQIARAWGLHTVNIVRDRPNFSELKSFLMDLGATEVLTLEELRKTEIFKTDQLCKPQLALNCVGGKNALEMLRYLGQGGIMVTYGGMSREPVTIPTSALIFKDIQARGFWMTNWSKQHANSPERMEMFEELISMMVNNELRGPMTEMIDFDQYEEALGNAISISGMLGKKYVLNFK